jgi:hypothetical protein
MLRGLQVKHRNHAVKAVGLLVLTLALASCAATGPAAAPTTSRAPGVASTIGNPGTPPGYPGFTRALRGGVEYFCQVRNPTGSRARVAEQCYTRVEMQRMEENNQQLWKDAGGSSSHDSLQMDSPR